jgi:hypothetical protein
MKNQSRATQGLLMTYSPGVSNGTDDAGPTPSKLAEAVIRILGACLLLYQQQVATREYYEVHYTN